MAIQSVDQAPRYTIEQLNEVERATEQRIRAEIARERSRTDTVDDVFLKCQQVAGMLAAIAQSTASQEETINAVWGVLALAHEAQDMAEALCGSASKVEGA